MLAEFLDYGFMFNDLVPSTEAL